MKKNISTPKPSCMQSNIKNANSAFFRGFARSFILLLLALLWSLENFGQVNISAGNTITETFTIGTSATATLPTGWKMDKSTSARTLGSYAAAVTATEQAGGNSMSTTASNGIYNYAAGDAATATDRAIGGLSSSTASKSVNAYLYLRNSGATTINDFTISYNVEKYRKGSNAAGYSIQMYYSTNGSTWTSAGSNFLTSFAADADNTGYTSAPGVTSPVTNKTLTISITSGSSLYLAWNYSVTSGTTTSNAQALGIDDVSITANGSAGPLLSVTPNSLSGFTYMVGSGPSTSQSYSLSGSNLTTYPGNIAVGCLTNYEVSLDNVTFTSSVNVPYTSATLAATTIYVRLVGGLAIGTYNSETVSNSGGGATAVNVTCNGQVTSSLCISEGFNAGASAPAGWTFTGITSTYTTSGNYGVSSPSVSFDDTGDRILTPTVSSATELSFWIKGQGTNPTSALLVEGFDGVTWNTIENITSSLPTTGTTKTYNASSSPVLQPGFTQFRFTYTKGAGNLAFDDVSVTCSTTTPTLVASPSSLSGMTYGFGYGPSNITSYDLSGSNLTSAPGNILVTGSTNYEVSLDGSTFTNTVNVAYSSATLNTTAVYVRLKSGRSVGTYNAEIISNAGGGATTVNVTCNGTVTGPTLTANPTSLINLNYNVGAGPSPEQSYVLSGVNLTAGPVTITAPANFEISLTSGSGFADNLNLSYTAPTLNATTLYVRLKSGLAIGSYSGNITHTGGSASVNVALSGIVIDPAAGPTIFDPGDLAVVGVNSNIKCIYADDGADEISFVAFKDINTGTTFYATDNGWQRTTAGLWGDTEGVYEFTRTGGTIAAGTVITFRFLNISPFMIFVSPDNGWTFTKVPGISGQLVLNTNGDQIYFMQGGTWSNGAGTHDLSYSGGTFLFAFNTYSSWNDFGASTQRSGLIPGMECFSMMPGVATDFIKYTGQSSADWDPTTKRGWINRINNPANWTNCRSTPFTTDNSCILYNATTPDYAAGKTISITAGGFSPGIWTGTKDINWFDCSNWQDLQIPDRDVNVTIPSTAVPNEPTIGVPPVYPVAYVGAECNDLDIQTGRTLTMDQATSRLDVYNNWTQEGTINFSNGIVNILDDNSTMTGSAAKAFYNLALNKTANTNTLTLGSGITIQNALTMTKGVFVNGSNVIELGTSTANLGTLNYTAGYIAGTMRRWFSGTNTGYSTGLFPLGHNVSGYKNRHYYIQFTGAPAIPGYLEVYFNPVAMGTAGIPVNGIPAVGSCTTFNVTQTNYEGYWVATPGAGALGGCNYTLACTGEGFSGVTSLCQLTLLKRVGAGNWLAQGTHLAPTGSVAIPTVSRSSMNGFSNFGFGADNTNPLPVELLSFNGFEDNGAVRLEWSTATEINNHYFALERSADAKKYEVIGTVKGAGNSNNVLNYSFTDPEPYAGISYYKLIQYDFDGKQETYGPVAVQFNAEAARAFSIVNINNNGTKPQITYYITSSEKVMVCVYDVNGREIFCTGHTGEAGYRQMDLDLQTGAGLYFVTLSDGNKVLSAKLLMK